MDIGVIAPGILNKINTKRNKLEHEFKKPTITEVRDYFDVAELFMSCTNQFLKNFTDFEVHASKIEDDTPRGEIYLFSKEGLIKVIYKTSLNKTDFEVPLVEIEIYTKLLSYLVRFIQDR